MYNYEKNREQVVNDLDRVIKLIHMKADEIPEEEKAQMVKETVEHFNSYVSPGWINYRKCISSETEGNAVLEWEDGGSYFRGLYDNEVFLDAMGGFGIYVAGHSEDLIIDTVKAQLSRQGLHSQELIDPLRGYLAKAMADCTPGDLQQCFFTNCGTEAVEIAMKLARFKSKGKWFISTTHAFHGKTGGSLSLTAKGIYRQPYLPLIQQVQHVEYGNAAAIRTAIENLREVGESIAAVVLEPIQGEAGVIIPPEGYLKEVRAICDELNVLLIIDEIQTGMGRTGTLWRCDAEGIVPDIMTFGKAFGGGVMPITGLIFRPEMWSEELVENPYLLGSTTFGGNPVCCAAAIAALDFQLKNDVPGQAREKGAKIKAGLEAIQAKYPTVIKEVRGVGMMMAVEFFSDEYGYEFSKEMYNQHVIISGTLNNSKSIRFAPRFSHPRRDRKDPGCLRQGGSQGEGSVRTLRQHLFLRLMKYILPPEKLSAPERPFHLMTDRRFIHEDLQKLY